jgi:hypothetical protein
MFRVKTGGDTAPPLRVTPIFVGAMPMCSPDLKHVTQEIEMHPLLTSDFPMCSVWAIIKAKDKRLLMLDGVAHEPRT